MTAAERLDTDPSAPPSDSLAEAVVLYVCELWPEVIDRYDLGPLLLCSEHKALWRALVRVRMQHPTMPGNQFSTRYWQACWSDPYLSRCLALVQTVPDDLDRDYWRRWVSAAKDWKRHGEWTVPEKHSADVLDIDYWHGRLQRVATARSLISHAQGVAEAAWRLDTDTARFMARRASQIGAPEPATRAPIELTAPRFDFAALGL